MPDRVGADDLLKDRAILSQKMNKKTTDCLKAIFNGFSQEHIAKAKLIVGY